MDIGFHCFDVSADGNVEAKVYWNLILSVQVEISNSIFIVRKKQYLITAF